MANIKLIMGEIQKEVEVNQYAEDNIYVVKSSDTVFKIIVGDITVKFRFSDEGAGKFVYELKKVIRGEEK